jgi:hypothetical protein
MLGEISMDLLQVVLRRLAGLFLPGEHAHGRDAVEGEVAERALMPRIRSAAARPSWIKSSAAALLGDSGRPTAVIASNGSLRRRTA